MMNIKLDLNKILIYAYQIVFKFLIKLVHFILAYADVFRLIILKILILLKNILKNWI